MSRRLSGNASSSCYDVNLRCAMARFLPRRGLALLPGDGKVRWTARLLVMQAVLVSWSLGQSLIDRFALARQSLVQWHRGRRRPGETYEGFAAALLGHSEKLLQQLCDHWRGCVRQVAQRGNCWKVSGWTLFGVDGSKFDCPRTVANERAFGVSGKNNSGPQQLATCLFHLGSGLPWAWKRSGLAGSEVSHLRQMLPLLPEASLLVADAGYRGYELLREIMAGGRGFLVRVGSSMTLLTKLGYAYREHDQVVYLWPKGRQGRDRQGRAPKDLARTSEPLVLRLIVLKDQRGRSMYLLSSVLNRQQLGDALARRIYAMRWGIELLWRGLKQTMGRRKLLSQSPRHAEVELDWSMAGLWLLQLLAVSRMIGSGRSPQRYSLASVLRVARAAMHASGENGVRRGGGFWVSLGRAVKDGYCRRGSKRARHYPHRKRQRPPGAPRARTASRSEVALARRLRARLHRRSLAA